MVAEVSDSTANKNPIRIPNELMRELKLAQVDEWQRSGTTPSYGDLLAEAWEKAKTSTTSEPASPPEPPTTNPHQPWINKLVNILERGTDLDRIGIQSNLDAFCAKIQLENPPTRRKKAAGE